MCGTTLMAGSCPPSPGFEPCAILICSSSAERRYAAVTPNLADATCFVRLPSQSPDGERANRSGSSPPSPPLLRAPNLFIEPYRLSLVEQRLVVDLRDDPLRPRRGFYGSVVVREAGGPLFGDFTFLSIAPDARVYLPLGSHFGLHGRANLGAIVPIPYDARNPIDGVPLPYRFYAGGPTSNRGYAYREMGPLECIQAAPVGDRKSVV